MSSRLEDYEVLDVIGRGTFGICYKVRSRIDNGIFVWKAVDYGKLTEQNKKNLVSEVNLLSRLDHPNIVKYYNRILHVETTTLYIITEWCQGGDLSSLIKATKSSGQILQEDFIWQVLYQVSKAIQVCHTKLVGFTVLHRDIKPANVFLDGFGNAKLGDFGLAQVEREENNVAGIVGTPYYLSPELIRGHRHTRKSDIWALGCLVYEMCSLEPPFNGAHIKELRNNIKVGKYKDIPSFFSNNLKKVIAFMLSVKHEFRPTIEMILHHPIVVMNIKKKSMEELCSKASNLSISAEEVTDSMFKGKWLSRLETLREREAKLKEKEEGIAMKERSLMNKERHLAILERQARDRLVFAEVYNRRRKDPQLSARIHNLDSTDVSADPGDSLKTAVRLDPNQIARPGFARNTIETKSKRVHFRDRYALKENIEPARIDRKETSGKENIVVKPIKKPDKTFKLIRFI